MSSKPFEITLRPHVLKGRELEYLLVVSMMEKSLNFVLGVVPN